MRISLRQLEVFAAIAATGQVTRAAASVALTQAAASMALAELEGLLGVRLFDRIGRRLHLTACGRELLGLTREVLDRVQDIESRCAQERGGGALLPADQAPITLHLGASLTVGNHLLPAILADLEHAHPGSTLRLTIRNTEQVLAGLLEFRFDAGFVEGPVKDARLQRLPWHRDRLRVFAPPGHPWIDQEQVSRAQLLSAPWVLREQGSGTREVFERALGESPPRVLELEQPEAIRQAVRAGLGLGCLSELELAEALQFGAVHTLNTPELDLERDFSLVLHRDRFRTRGVRQLLQRCGMALE